MLSSRSFLLASAIALGVAPSYATPVRWEFDIPLDPMQVPDGSPEARASGHFTYDDDLKQYSDIDFTTTPKGDFAGAHYTRPKSGYTPSSIAMIFLGTSADGDPYEFFMAFLPTITNAGGTVRLVESESGEQACLNSECTEYDFSQHPRWTLYNDALHGTPVESVPEPGSLTMAGLGLLGLGLVGFRRRTR